MKYLFGDSTEFPMKRDFLGLLDNFIDTSVKSIKLENTVFDLKENVKDRRRLRNSVLDEMESFLLTVENAITGAVLKSKEQETIIGYAEKSKEFLKKFIEDGKSKFSEEIFQEIAEFEDKINRADEENRKTLESFFINDPITIINKKYSIKAKEAGYSAKVQLDCEGQVSCVFEIATSGLPFWKYSVKTHDFVRGIVIPAGMKKPFLKKELVPDIVGIDDYILSELDLSGKELEIVLRKRHDPAAERFRMKMDFTEDFSIQVFHAEEKGVEKNIMAVPELVGELKTLRLRELGEKIIEKTNDLYTKKHRLETIYLGGNDVFEENMVFELMQKVAESFAPVVALVKEHSPSEEELSLKAEDESNKRSEIYLRRSHIREKLGVLSQKGESLLGILGI